ncbi:MAG: hypothetical protein V3T58_02510 [Candidatus Hydrothermarchaeales archaeon]
MEEWEYRRPKKTDDAFKSRTQDWWNNATIDSKDLYKSGEGNWNIYAEGYKRAGDWLFERVNQGRADQDFVVYPIVFLYRHAIELKLKWIIEIGGRLIDEPRDLRISHDLIALWKECREILEKVWSEGSSDTLDTAEKIINQFSKEDPESMTFRYPVDTDGNFLIPDSKLINLENLKDVVEGIYNLLNGSSTGISEYLDGKYESEYHRQQEQF